MAKSDSFSEEVDALTSVLKTLEALNETQRAFVLATACQRFGAAAPSSPIRTSNLAGAVLSGTPAGIPPAAGSLENTTPKDFVASKHPVTDAQKVACLAYYLAHVRKVDHFKTGDVRKLSIEAKFTMSNFAVAVMNATQSNKFLAPVGGGKKQLSLLGEEVVNALPDQKAVKTIIANHRPRKRTRRKKGASKS